MLVPGSPSDNVASDSTTILPAPVAPTLKVTLSATTITTQQALTVGVSVSGGSGRPTATGSVKVASGSYASSAVTLKSGEATIAIPAGKLAVGVDTLTTTYTPDTASSPRYTKAMSETKVTVK